MLMAVLAMVLLYRLLDHSYFKRDFFHQTLMSAYLDMVVCKNVRTLRDLMSAYALKAMSWMWTTDVPV